MGGGGGTVIITSAPGPGLCHSQRFFERFFGDSLRDSYGMDLDRSLTKVKSCCYRNQSSTVHQVRSPDPQVSSAIKSSRDIIY